MNQLIIYTSEDETSYTKSDILELIELWRKENKLTLDEKMLDNVYNSVLSLCEWQCPYTILCELDDDDLMSLGVIENI